MTEPHLARAVRLICTVRQCGELLTLEGPSYRCPRGHSFDVAASGYVNLLQPQDRRSLQAGDSQEAVRARRRLTASGADSWITDELLKVVESSATRSVLDVGCGEGSHLGAISNRTGVEAEGVDLSIPAIRMAAGAHPSPRWIVANADRMLPYQSGSFGLVMSVTARLPLEEMLRVLRPDGRLLVVIAGNDDLAELRERLLGRADEKDRAARFIEKAGDALTLIERWSARQVVPADQKTLRDLMTITYRSGRRLRDERAGSIDRLDVTSSREFLLFGGRGR